MMHAVDEAIDKWINKTEKSLLPISVAAPCSAPTVSALVEPDGSGKSVLKRVDFQS